MATRKPTQPTPPLRLTDELAWYLAFLVNKAVVLIEHDGQKLPVPGASHIAAEMADEDLTEFNRRFRRA